MIFTKVRPEQRLTRAVGIAMVAAVATLAFLGALSTAVLGAHIRGASRFATLSLIRQISVADFITNLDAVAIGAWVSTGFVKISLCLYVCATSVAELFSLASYRPYVLPIGAAMVSLSLLVFRDTSQMAAALALWPTYSAPFQILIPLLLLGVSLLRPVGGERHVDS
jgi:spore germination protein KB